MKYLSLFTGIGGFELGIQYAYQSLRDAQRSAERGSQDDPEKKKGQGLLPAKGKGARATKGSDRQRTPNGTIERPLCIGYSEIDPYAIKIFDQHFPGLTNFGDITQIDESGLPDFDLVVGGFPCQSFSIAGKRGGFMDTRGTLFFDIARIIKQKQPRLLLLENVQGLLSHDRGETFRTIIASLDELGYDLQWQVLNGKAWLPQNRQRILIVGHLRGTPRPQVFPLGEIEGVAYQATGDERQEVAAALKAKQGGPDLENSYLIGEQIRRLTPLECERLQGFPDGWTEYGSTYQKGKMEIETIYKMSDTQRYKLLGNAVMVPMIQSVATRLIKG